MGMISDVHSQLPSEGALPNIRQPIDEFYETKLSGQIRDLLIV